MKTLYLFLIVALMTSLNTSAQVSAENEGTVNFYIQDLFLGEAISISNITVNGMSGDSINSQVGSFENNDGYLPLTSGVVLSTGDVLGEGFNAEEIIFGEETTISTTSAFYTDPDLELLSGEPTNDVISIEFDFVPALDFLVYDYVFGSEEYPEFVNSFNDAFGFFIAGPGIEGPYSAPEDFPMGSKNAAFLPGTSTAVTINNVNNGNFNCPSPASGPCVNCEFYIDNCPIDTIALDGMTTQLMVIETVIPGETYHIKLSIGDALDQAYDSAVLLKEGSFRSMAQPPNPLGVTEVENEELNLAINPVGDYLTLQNIPTHVTQYSVQDLNGRSAITLTQINSSVVTRDVSDLNTGIYLLTLHDNEGRTWTQKLVKE